MKCIIICTYRHTHTHTYKNEKQNDQHEEIKYHVQFWGNLSVHVCVFSMCETVIMSAKRKAAAVEEDEYYSDIIGCRIYTSYPIRIIVRRTHTHTYTLSPQKRKKNEEKLKKKPSYRL